MTSEFVPPTYEEYVKATLFARFRYQWGLFVTFGAIVCLLVLIGFIYIYAHELTTEPLNYAAEKYNAQCTCTNENYKYEFNATQTYITPINQEDIWKNPLGDLKIET